ncbi:unnamed protein product [Acidithrix sp. C25]|nr:unnamed protein product [Acidithrix sp. C25]
MQYLRLRYLWPQFVSTTLKVIGPSQIAVVLGTFYLDFKLDPFSPMVNLGRSGVAQRVNL